MTDSYLSISKASEGQYKDRGSKFLAFAFPVSTEEEIGNRLTELRKKYHDARHHCFAWRLKAAQSMSRANDDGEPSNSAGKPILNQIEARDLTNVLVVVVRYFGGTKLGVGGLINAYKSAAYEALSNSEITRKYMYKSYKIFFQYGLMNDVMRIIKEYDLENYDQQFELNCSLKIRVKVDISDKVTEALEMLKGCEFEEL